MATMLANEPDMHLAKFLVDLNTIENLPQNLYKNHQNTVIDNGYKVKQPCQMTGFDQTGYRGING